MLHKIFLFHRVSSHRDSLWDPMDPSLFRKCIKYITEKYRVVNLENWLEKPEKSGTKTIASIVFDDGYKDNIQYAAPILADYGIKASYYVVTNSLDHQQLTWTHQLEYSFQNTNKLSIDLSGFQQVPDQWQSVSWNSVQERLNYAARLKPLLKKISHKKRQAILSAIAAQFNDVKLPTDMMMNWDDIRILKKQGHVVGSHTVNHLMLGTIGDKSKIEEELIISAKRIQEETGEFPNTISYPVGSYNQKVIELSKKVGYKYGLAVKQKFYKPDKDDIFEIPRTELYNEPWWKTQMRISGSLEKIKKLIRK